MALYQYTFDLIERKSMEDLISAQQFFEGSVFNEEPYWIYSNKPKRLFSEVEGILVKVRSWSDEIDLYGA